MNSMLASLNSRKSIKGTLFNSSDDKRAYTLSNDAQAGNRVNLNIMNSKVDANNMHNAVTVTVERESFEEIGRKVRLDLPRVGTASN